MSDFGSMILKQRLSKVICLDSTHLNEKLAEIENVLIATKGQPPTLQEEVFEEIIQFSHLKDPRIKKLVYLYLTLAVKIYPDLLLLMTNSIFADLSDPSPIVRSCAIRSVTMLHVNWEKLSELVLRSIEKGLQDPTPSVRCLAVMGIAQIFNQSQDELKHFLETVMKLLESDPDPAVVVNCVRCIAHCDVTNPSLHQYIQSLIERIDLLEYWPRVMILTLANSKLKCEKFSENQVFKVLNILDPITKLTSRTSLSMGSFSLMLKLSKDLFNVKRDVTAHLVARYLRILTFSSSAQKFVIFRCLGQFVMDRNNSNAKTQLQNQLHHFILLYGDSKHIKVEKLKLLCLLASQQNAEMIFNNLKPYLHRTNQPNVVKSAFDLLGALYTFLPSAILSTLNRLLTSKQPIILDACVAVLAKIMSTSSESESKQILFSKDLTKNLLLSYNSLLSDVSKSSVLWLVVQNATEIHLKQLHDIMSTETSLYFGDTIINNVMTYWILRTLVLLFLKWPKCFEHSLKVAFTKIVALGKGVLYDNVKLYYGVLKHNNAMAMEVLNSAGPIVFNGETSVFDVEDNFNAISQIALSVKNK